MAAMHTLQQKKKKLADEIKKYTLNIVPVNNCNYKVGEVYNKAKLTTKKTSD